MRSDERDRSDDERRGSQGQVDAPRGRRSPERRRAHALTDAALVTAMRGAGDPWAWGEFVARFQPLLLAFARRIGVPAGERLSLVDEVLTDEALRFTAERRARMPDQLGAYLMRATRNRQLRARRAQTRRATHYAAASAEADRSSHELVIPSSCSAHSLRLVREPALLEELDIDAPVRTQAIAHLVATLRGSLTPDEEQLLGWHGAQVPHREIARWLGVSYDAATKRIWRLAKRVRAQSMIAIAAFPPAEREALRAFLARADVEIDGMPDRLQDRQECV